MKTKTLTSVKAELERVISLLEKAGPRNELDCVKNKTLSAINLNQYYSLRQLDLSKLQIKLKKLGISRLARSESHIMHSLLMAHTLVSALLKTSDKLKAKDYITIIKSEKQLIKNAAQLFGKSSKNKRLKLMVTMPSEAADDYQMVEDLVLQGMDCARINCAHDSATDWRKMADHIRKAANENKRTVLIAMDLGGPKIRTAIESAEGLMLNMDDQLEIIDDSLPFEEHKKQIRCTLPELFQKVKKGEHIYFDDGKIEGIIQKVKEGSIHIKITRCKPEGSELKTDKGINLPDSILDINGLTEKDREDFKTVAQIADIVNFSFVNTVNDINSLYELMDKHKASHLGVILKIETKTAYNNLHTLLLKTMTRENPVGVMMARGDLAIEVGWQNLGRVQNEIIRMCAAAHVPLIWATQVLENLAKKGIPSRSEMTDITYALKTECIMLNKGPFMGDVMKILNKVIEQEKAYQHKMDAMLPVLEKL